MAERNDAFWKSTEVKLSTFEGHWYRQYVSPVSTEEEVTSVSANNCSMGGRLDGVLEKSVGSHLCLAGPMVDVYLREIGAAMEAKLAKKSTGLAAPIIMLIPWQVQRHITSLSTGYGADVKFVDAKDKKKERLVIFIDKQSTAEKLFHPSRFDGTNFLSKRFFKKVPNLMTSKQDLEYNGYAKVVVGP